MSEILAATSVLEQVEEVQPLLELIDSIVAISEENFTTQIVESLQGMIKGSMTDSMHHEAVESSITSFEQQGLTREQARASVDAIKAEFNQYVDNLAPNKMQREVIDTALNILYSIFDDALIKFHNYNIVLPFTVESGAHVPTYAHDSDACADLYAQETVTLEPHSMGNMIKTGIRMALPEGWMAMIFPRSSIGSKTPLRLSNSVGIIDEEYRGPVNVLYDNLSDSEYTINAGDRIAQLLVIPSYKFQPQVVTDLPDSTRGENGFGSTGQ